MLMAFVCRMDPNDSSLSSWAKKRELNWRTQPRYLPQITEFWGQGHIQDGSPQNQPFNVLTSRRSTSDLFALRESQLVTGLEAAAPSTGDEEVVRLVDSLKYGMSLDCPNMRHSGLIAITARLVI